MREQTAGESLQLYQKGPHCRYFETISELFIDQFRQHQILLTDFNLPGVSNAI